MRCDLKINYVRKHARPKATALLVAVMAEM